MTINNAIKILNWGIEHKKTGLEKLKTKWNYEKYDDASEVAKMLFDVDRITISNLERIRSDLVPNCKHPKNVRDRSDGQWYCMACNLDL